MKLVACPACRTQYDVTDVSAESIACRCGARIDLTALAAVAKDAAVARCAACGALVGEKDRTCPYCRAAIARQLSPTGPVCPQCYARNPEGAKHCVACGIEFAPQPVAATESAACPVCDGVALRARSLGGIWVDECPSCLGLWAPGNTLDRLVERVRDRYQREGASARADTKHRAAWQAEVAYRKCPVCHGMMQRKNFAGHSGVVVDWCGDHGVWLDAGETEDIASFVLAGGLRDRATDLSATALAGDPARVKAALAAERILAEERARSAASQRPRGIDWDDTLRGVGDLFAKLLK